MTKNDGKPIRFAALIRVSTEKQAARGESLRTQTTQIDNAVASLGGKVAVRYAGQEHATSGWERIQLDKLLNDAKNPRRVFDAVIVADPSRWSRDNLASETGLTILRDAGVRFYVLTTDYDLFDPDRRFFLAMFSTVAGHQAATQKKKSLLNRIARARRGIPTTGKVPFGRIWNDAKQEWSVDPQKRAMIREIAERYLAGESLPKLAKEFGQNHTNICKVLRERCGESWTQTFESKDLNIAETVTTTIPRLLPESTVRALRQRLEANRTYRRKGGQLKNEYLLSGRVFCGECGYAMFGQKNANGKLYYRHAHTHRDRDCSLKEPRPWIRADIIEKAVLAEFDLMLSDETALSLAIKATVPDADKLLERKTRQSTQLAKLEKGRQRILSLIRNDAISDEDATEQLASMKKDEIALRSDIAKLEESLDAIEQPLPDLEVALADVLNGGGSRKLLQSLLDGAQPNGRPTGVYLWPVGAQKQRRKSFRYEIRGRFSCLAHDVVSHASY